jgi:RNA polymerase sigma-70 factor, ECF subfamily
MTPAATAVVDSLAAPTTAEEAVAAARRGDHAAWDWIFDRFYRTVLRYCAGRIGASPHAEDAAQEVFIAAVSAVERLRDTTEAGIEGWLLGIARYKCIDGLRALQRDRSATAPDLAIEDASEVAVGRLTADDVRAALEQLADRQREVIVRRFVMQQTLEEVAAATGRPVGAVKSMQHRALAQLAKRCRGIR